LSPLGRICYILLSCHGVMSVRIEFGLEESNVRRKTGSRGEEDDNVSFPKGVSLRYYSHTMEI